jgi:hypothetical protein
MSRPQDEIYGTLRSVVLVHELGHWIMHCLPAEGVPEYPLGLYQLTAAGVHEGFAQLAAHWVAEVPGNASFH